MQISRGTGEYRAEIRERPGWLVPVAILIVTTVLGAAFLLYYLGPNPGALIEQRASPTARTEPVQLRIGGLSLTIPANYLPFASARSGGARRSVALYAELPDFRGYSDARAQTFSRNNPAIVTMSIRQEEFDVPEAEKLRRIYLGDVTDAKGTSAPFGLIEYTFRDDSGYRGEDLLVGQVGGRAVVMRCVRANAEPTEPACMRDVWLARGVALSYRFERSHLASWREIARGVDRLAASFARRAG